MATASRTDRATAGRSARDGRSRRLSGPDPASTHFRASPVGGLVCESYEITDSGVELYDGDEQFIGFIPFSNLRELLNDEVYSPMKDDMSIY